MQTYSVVAGPRSLPESSMYVAPDWFSLTTIDCTFVPRSKTDMNSASF